MQSRIIYACTRRVGVPFHEDRGANRGTLVNMTLVQATRLAATGCVLELGFSIAENANSLIGGGTVSLSTAGAAVLAYFPLVSVCLFLLALYYEFAQRGKFLSVRVCALLAAFGAISTTALTISGLLTHRIYFLNALQYLHGFGLVVTLRICWVVLFGLFAAGARPPGSAAMRAVAVVTAVLQGLAGLWDGYFLLRRVVGLWPVEFGRAAGWVPWALAGAAIRLFVWISLCVFLIEVWRKGRSDASASSAEPRP